jgi:hypothetical protein
MPDVVELTEELERRAKALESPIVAADEYERAKYRSDPRDNGYKGVDCSISASRSTSLNVFGTTLGSDSPRLTAA